MVSTFYAPIDVYGKWRLYNKWSNKSENQGAWILYKNGLPKYKNEIDYKTNFVFPRMNFDFKGWKKIKKRERKKYN